MRCDRLQSFPDALALICQIPPLPGLRVALHATYVLTHWEAHVFF